MFLYFMSILNKTTCISDSTEKFKCWICNKEASTKICNSSQSIVFVSLLPKSYASHHVKSKDVESLWSNTNKYINSNNFQNIECAYLCWDCAH